MRNTILKLGLFVVSSVLVFGQPRARLASDLPDKGGKKVDVIIQFNDPPGHSHLNSVKSGELKRKLPAIDGAVFSMPVKALKGLAHNPRIKYVSPDRRVQATLDYAHPTVGADLAQSYGWSGEGVGVAVIDSGIMLVDDLKNEKGSGSRILSERPEYFLRLPNRATPQKRTTTPRSRRIC